MNANYLIGRKRLKLALDVLFVPLIAFIITLKLQEFFSIDLLLLTAAAVYLLKNLFLDDLPPSFVRLNMLDLSVSLLALVEAVSYWESSYRANSFYFIAEVFFFLLFYFLVRFNLQAEYQRLALFLFLSLWALLLPLVGFVYFYRLNAYLHTIGFNDITNFRNYIYVLNPIGLSIGEWVTVLFLVAAFPAVLFVRFRNHRYLKYVFGCAVAFTLLILLLTFIRGVYIAVAAFFLASTLLFRYYGLFPLKRLLLFDALLIALTLLPLLPLVRPVLTTVSMLKTTSQVRSFEGRRGIWRNSLEMVRDHPLLGVGAGNFPMQYVAYKRPEEESAIAPRPFNYFVQILTEKGVVGLAVYLFVTASFFIVSHRKVKLEANNVYRQSAVIIFVAAYIAILVRDLSESSILTNKGVQILLWFIFAHNAQPAQADPRRGGPVDS